jgi:hypothetical protein
VNRAAKLVSLSAGDVELVSHTVIEVAAVLSAARRAVVSGRYDNVVLDDDSAVLFAQAGATLGDRLRYVKIIIML